MLNQDHMLNTAIQAVKRAAEEIGYTPFTPNSVYIKGKKNGKNDFVTDIDYKVEKKVLSELQTSFPEHRILSEESGYLGNNNSDYLWILDPIDGTENLTHNLPHFCIALALQYKNSTQLAVTYQPATDYLFTAAKDKGAFLNGKRIKCTNKPQTSSMLCIGTFSNMLQKLISRVDIKSLRVTCACALDLCYVAMGSFDCFIVEDKPLNPWDYLGGMLIVKEAGGIILPLAKEKEGLFIAGAPSYAQTIHSALMQLQSNA